MHRARGPGRSSVHAHGSQSNLLHECAACSITGVVHLQRLLAVTHHETFSPVYPVISHRSVHWQLCRKPFPDEDLQDPSFARSTPGVLDAACCGNIQ
eukprot:scaffold6008_cov20-Tisochrysis_lutea.AAC.1